jgi:hypothetical protein
MQLMIFLGLLENRLFWMRSSFVRCPGEARFAPTSVLCGSRQSELRGNDIGKDWMDSRLEIYKNGR